MGSRVEWVFFDLDGTLVDHERAADAAVDHLGDCYEALLVGLGRPGLRAMWRELQKEWFNEYLRGRCTFAEQRARRVRALWAHVGAQPPADHQVEVIFGRYLSAYEAAWMPFDDVGPCLERLQPFRLGVITNGDREQQLRKLEVCGLRDRFEVVVTSSEVGQSKPAPAVFRAALGSVDARASACCYIGDRLETDALAAAKVGMRGVWLDRQSSDTSGPASGQVERISTLDAFTP